MTPLLWLVTTLALLVTPVLDGRGVPVVTGPDVPTPSGRVMARPDGDSGGQDAFTAPQSARHHTDTTHFRLHWTSETDDATDVNFVQQAGVVFEEVWQLQVEQLGWPPPAPDGQLGGSDKIDIYFVDLDGGAYGYATADEAPLCDRCRAHGYLVMDNDYRGFAPDAVGALRSTAAHEFSHLVHFAIAYDAEGWAYEATAVWIEQRSYPDVDARTQYLADFAAGPELPLTDFGHASGGFDRAYGAYVLNMWLAHRFGPGVIRDAWLDAARVDDHMMEGYDSALRRRGTSLHEELVVFMAATAAWDVGGFPAEISDYPMVQRQSSLDQDSVVEVGIDHSAVFMADVTALGDVRVTVRGPKFVAGGIALVAVSGSTVRTAIDDSLFDGTATVSLDGIRSDTRVTLVVVNSDTSLAVPKKPGSDLARYLFDDVDYRIGVDVEPGRLTKR